MESSREEILKSIRKNLPEKAPLPHIPNFIQSDIKVQSIFEESIRKIGGEIQHVESYQQIEKELSQYKIKLDRIYTTIPELQNISNFSTEVLQEWGGLNAGVFVGDFGVAENGTVWVPEGNVQVRVLPFICQHLFLVLKADQIVQNMHEAYDRISSYDQGYGVFIAGPSKTADIEQSLVIGAHGPLSHTIFLIK